MARIEIPMGKRLAKAKSKFVSAQTLVNCFFEIDKETGQVALYGGPGLSSFASLTGQGVRGAIDFNGTLVVVSGTRLYTVTRAALVTDMGSIPGSGPVILAHNGSQVAVVADPLGYIFNGSAVAQITDPDFPQVTSVCFLDQYFVFSKKNSGSFVLSAINDGTAYDALDIASAERRPDNIMRVWTDADEVLLLGTSSLEGQYDSGNADFPFSRTSTFSNYGLAGVNAITSADNTTFWMDQYFTIRALRGGTAEQVSDDALHAVIAEWDSPGDAIGFTITFRGHEFVGFRHTDGCILLDVKTGAWMERNSYESSTWRVGCAVQIWGMTICGDADTGDLYLVNDDAQDEAGDPLVRYLVSRTMVMGGAPFTLDGLEIEIEPGVSILSGQGSDAKVWIEASRNSGYTFGARMERSVGAIGQRDKRITWGPFGQFPTHGGVLRLGCSDPVALVVGRAWADVTQDMA